MLSFTARMGRETLVCIVLLTFSIMPAAAQISPGPLSHAHRSLSGAMHCISCHKLSPGKATFQCLECHGEIASRLDSHSGLHATYGIKPGSSDRCITCHSEHNGADFQLIKWDVRTFDHTKTGYALEGKHAGLACNRCHNAAHVVPSEAASIRLKDLNKTFLGVPTTCVTCHQDPHKARLGSDCLQCHDFADWKSLRIGKFDHSRTRYPLTGMHVQVACRDCHTPGPDKKPRYTGIAFGKCEDCHSDPHRGGFDQSCASCHSTAGWKQLSASSLEQSVDHAHTRFPLLGRHAEVGCVQCHAGGDFKKPLAFKTCADCHHPDPHGGQFAKRSDHGECASCHTVNGFKPSTFGLKQHAATAYPLLGKHAELACGQCHIPKGKDTVYKLKFQRCTDCHKDPHAGQFAAAPHFGRCEGCHNVQKFQPSTFTLARHKETGFALTGGHVATPCNDCHKPSSAFRPQPAVVYHWAQLACTTCHADPHKGQFARLMRQSGPRARGCELCHSTEAWNDFSPFDHSRTSFPLEGAHKTTACTACHKPSRSGLSLAEANFQSAPSKCEACHQDIHGGQFARRSITACAECHNSAQWKPAFFDHNQRTSFPLEGAHRKTRCEGCHKLQRMIGGKPVLFYKPTPKDCIACHGPNAPKTTTRLYRRSLYEWAVLTRCVHRRTAMGNIEAVAEDSAA
jgi:hypothetical protein